MAAQGTSGARAVVDGKFFRLGGHKFFPKGVTYGPFAPNAREETFPEASQAEKDFQQIGLLGANLIRVYHLPPRWLLDLAERYGLKVLVDIPWPKHLCFLDSEDLRQEARRTVRTAVAENKGHPAVFAYSVVNEVPAQIVRWSGARRMEEFIDELVGEARTADPECLCTFTNYPSTEYLHPSEIDFVAFNVYLHERPAFESYLARLQMLADTKPLLLAELGMDSIREGEAEQAAFLSWQIESACRSGVAGTIVFSFSDDWMRGGEQIEDWAFGLTRKDRSPKPSFEAVRRAFAAAPLFPLPRHPKVSVVVPSFNGASTLRSCLESLRRLNYPDYEVILVDDGSTDDTLEIARQFPDVRIIAHPQNRGLSAARNSGIMTAAGEIVAFTDVDCRADEDWLYWLVGDLVRSAFIGIGGHNLLPPEDSPVAAAVMASPGGPAHVMLTDREAEHLPGCNMAFYAWALHEIGGFDPVFRKAGDDVDVCWRLQEQGYKLGFSPGGFVWHHRRATVRAYLRQQGGYGEAEALLARKHPEYFNPVGRSVWRGRIYATAKPGVLVERSVVYHGLFGAGLFQRLYAPTPSSALMFCASLEYHVLFTLPILALSAAVSWLLPVALTSLLISVGICGLAALQASLHRSRLRFWSRPLVALLFFSQPIARGIERYRASLVGRSLPRPTDRAAFLRPPVGGDPTLVVTYWSKGEVDRGLFLRTIQHRLEAEGWLIRLDTGWTDFDLEILGSRWSRLRLTTVTEELEQGRRNLRCRLAPRWSLLARVLLGTVLGTELVVAGFLASLFPWIWMVLLSVPLLYWLLEHEQFSLQASMAVRLDETAASIGLIKLGARPTKL